MHENVHNPKIEFGRKYRDRVTGFVGTCTGMASYISGCDQVSLVPEVTDGKYPEGVWLDDERLIDVATDQPIARTSARGGPQSAPSKA
jgi:hypothetical protein